MAFHPIQQKPSSPFRPSVGIRLDSLSPTMHSPAPLLTRHLNQNSPHLQAATWETTQSQPPGAGQGVTVKVDLPPFLLPAGARQGPDLATVH